MEKEGRQGTNASSSVRAKRLRAPLRATFATPESDVTTESHITRLHHNKNATRSLRECPLAAVNSLTWQSLAGSIGVLCRHCADGGLRGMTNRDHRVPGKLLLQLLVLQEGLLLLVLVLRDGEGLLLGTKPIGCRRICGDVMDRGTRSRLCRRRVVQHACLRQLLLLRGR